MLVKAVVVFIFLFSLFAHAAELPSINGSSASVNDDLTSSVPASGGGFTLHSAGGPVSLSDFRGKIVIVFFGYTQCPDVCPVSMGIVVSAINELDSSLRSKIVPIFITLDPERDTPDLLASYVQHYYSSMIGLSGSPEQIKQVAGQYGIKYRRVPLPGSAMQYAINHSAAYFVIDKKGQLRFSFPHSYPAVILSEAVRYLVKSP